MIVYNVTTGVDKEVETEWLQWMLKEHIPHVMETNLFVSYKIFRVLSQQDDGGVSYSVQYSAKSMDDVHRYIHQHAPALREEHQQKFGERQVSFRTILEEVNA